MTHSGATVAYMRGSQLPLRSLRSRVAWQAAEALRCLAWRSLLRRLVVCGVAQVVVRVDAVQSLLQRKLVLQLQADAAEVRAGAGSYGAGPSASCGTVYLVWRCVPRRAGSRGLG